MARAGGVRIRERDRGYDRLVRQARKAGGRVEAGILEGQGAEDTYPNGETVAQVASEHELGLGVPERSWLRSTFDEHRRDMQQIMERMHRRVLFSKATPQQALDAVGERFVELMEEQILAGIEPPNSPQTIAEKGSALPLVDSGKFKNTLDHRTERRVLR